MPSFHGNLSRRTLATIVPLSFIGAGIVWKVWHLRRSSERTKMALDGLVSTGRKARRHPTYWFPDGTLIVRIRSDAEEDTSFRIHSSLIYRKSRLIQRILPESPHGAEPTTISIPPELGLQIADFTAVLEHLYHDSPLSPGASFPHVAAILRASGGDTLDMPDVHSLARSYVVSMFPSGPVPFAHPSHLEEALALATAHRIPSIRKGIFYSIVTTSDFEPEEPESPVPDLSGSPASSNADDDSSKISAPLSQRHILPLADVERCRNLMTAIVEHYTPILFTPPATPHMACTDVFADKWMPLVIHPALASDGVYKPLESLESIKGIDWGAQGLCPACAREKREEWAQEQADIWEKMDKWLDLDAESDWTE
ncbi:hypothetical protein BJ138DRAFT_1073203 [Hygrophoropsis aurantiaca]|uniref:Uncharacterized protein n=1 Tax=Hygrophoropsis aurantiaca TaxID=72124 RepID=A0ACB7ZW42_9AGAM|nr:hypothetical protein BJ138DRAFT_1073203 [Hygrophoropsis aurantiaca]